MDTSTFLPIAILVVILLAAAVIAWVSARGRQTEDLRHKYGPEYDYIVKQEGDQHAAEQSLREREKRVSKLAIRDLEARESELYHSKWVAIQSDFVDRPADSVEEADLLIQEVMEARGFPTADFEQRAADVSVLYPEVVANYRNAHAIALKSQRDAAATEDFRIAMVYYRSLFEELLGTETTQEKELKTS